MHLLLASVAYESSLNRHGIPLTVATDPANQFRWAPDEAPVVDWSEHYLRAKQDGYYAADTPEHPMNRAGHMWGVRLKPAEAETQSDQ